MSIQGHYNMLLIEKKNFYKEYKAKKKKTLKTAIYKIGIHEKAFYYHHITFSPHEIVNSSSLPNNVFISSLVGPRLHAGCRQESHLLTANYSQLMLKFTFILGWEEICGILWNKSVPAKYT